MGWLGWKAIPRTGPGNPRLFEPRSTNAQAYGAPQTIVLIIAIDECTHLVVPYLDAAAVEGSGEQRQLGMKCDACTVSSSVSGRPNVCLDLARLTFHPVGPTHSCQRVHSPSRKAKDTNLDSNFVSYSVNARS
jgi:hypothetical protein